jgi:hypothetical protein
MNTEMKNRAQKAQLNLQPGYQAQTQGIVYQPQIPPPLLPLQQVVPLQLVITQQPSTPLQPIVPPPAAQAFAVTQQLKPALR